MKELATREYPYGDAKMIYVHIYPKLLHFWCSQNS